MKKKRVLYPGTFDPITLGHMDVIKPMSLAFDEVIVAILINIEKDPKFGLEERLKMIEESAEEYGLHNIRAISFKGLTVDLAKKEKVMAIVRGLRLVMDYEAELGISFNNYILGNVHTIFVPSTQNHIHISSSIVRQMIFFNKKDELKNYVPPAVLNHILQT